MGICDSPWIAAAKGAKALRYEMIRLDRLDDLIGDQRPERNRAHRESLRVYEEAGRNCCDPK